MSKFEFSEEVLKWSHVWSPMEDCTEIEIRIINRIFENPDFKFDEEKKCFILENLRINNLRLKRLTFLPPLIIITTFNCSYNRIESLEGGPIEAIKYICNNNKLKDLRGAPKKCAWFECHVNPLEDFRVYAEPYYYYNTPNDSKLIFLDSNIWNNEEYDNNRDNIDISECYL